jgi:hypothetical protein
MPQSNKQPRNRDLVPNRKGNDAYLGQNQVGFFEVGYMTWFCAHPLQAHLHLTILPVQTSTGLKRIQKGFKTHLFCTLSILPAYTNLNQFKSTQIDWFQQNKLWIQSNKIIPVSHTVHEKHFERDIIHVRKNLDILPPRIIVQSMVNIIGESNGKASHKGCSRSNHIWVICIFLLFGGNISAFWLKIFS